MTNFCKNEDCPASSELLDYETGDMALDTGREISRHLASCEFCTAEVEFYSRYPQAQEEETTEITSIPGPLYELAEALLKNRHNNSASLDRLLRESEHIALDKA